MFRAVFWVILPCKMIVDHHFTQQYNPEDSSEHHTRRRENLKSHLVNVEREMLCYTCNHWGNLNCK
jgi:hypothetical protein